MILTMMVGLLGAGGVLHFQGSSPAAAYPDSSSSDFGVMNQEEQAEQASPVAEPISTETPPPTGSEPTEAATTVAETPTTVLESPEPTSSPSPAPTATESGERAADPAQSGAPANDGFSNATVIRDLPWRGTVDLRRATQAPDDPTNKGADPDALSVWYRYTANQDTKLLISAWDQAGARVSIKAYSGSRGNLTRFGGGLRRAEITVPAGRTVYLMLSTYFDRITGVVEVEVLRVRPMTNDSHSSALAINSTPYLAVVDAREWTWSATDPSVSYPPQAGSIWFTLMAPRTGTYILTTSRSTFANMLGAYTGSPGNWTSVAFAESGIRVKLRAGQKISIAVFARYPEESGIVLLSVRYRPSPANDEIGGATRVGALPWSYVAEKTGGATANITDPPVYNDGKRGRVTLWFKFVPGQSTNYTISHWRSDEYRQWFVAVYTGSPGNLTPVAVPDILGRLDPASKVFLTAGRTYYIIAAGYYPHGSTRLVLDVRRWTAQSASVPAGHGLATAPVLPVANAVLRRHRWWS